MITLARLDDLPCGLQKDSIRITAYPSAAAKETFLYVEKAGYLRAKPSYLVSYDSMDCFLLFFVINDNGMLEYEDRKYPLEAGNFFLIDCKKSYKFYTTVDEWKVIYIYFNGINASGYYHLLCDVEPPIVKSENYKLSNALFWDIIDLHTKNKDFAEELVSLQITRILTEMIMLRSKQKITNIFYPGYINEVFNHIARYSDDKITLDMLSELYTVNKYHLVREFKRCTGITVYEHVIRTRITRAKSLLHHTDKSIAEIAKEVGFNSSGHFVRMFSQREHITPLLYRKQWAE